jgi:AcrR family transcriptional regulator
MKSSYHHGNLKVALIDAGIAILNEQGLPALSLRNVAQRIGVSHTAPYAHYNDKHALIAAIAAAGYQEFTQTLQAIELQHADKPLAQLCSSAWAYYQFSQRSPAHFRLTFSGTVEQQHDYPDFIAAAHECFNQVLSIVGNAQRAQLLKPGPIELLTISVWGMVHGVVLLLLENLISHTILERQTPRELLATALSQIALVPISAADFPADEL